MKYLIIPIIIVLALLGACKKNSDSAVPDTHGNFEFVNATYAALEFNIKLDTINFASNVAYKTSTGYKSYLAKKYNLIITTSDRPDIILVNQELFLRNNRYYTAFMGIDSAKAGLAMILTEDDLSAPRADSAKFRVIDFSQAFKPNRAPLGLDVYAGNPTVIFKGLTFPSQTAFVPLRGDSTYTMKFNYVDSSLVLKSIPLAAQKGKVYTLVTAGYPLDAAQFDILTIQHN
ncbi:DUF4397 domain-containing protein [Chitinophaga sp.]|uniref:DUF4397 domain-containing protein n=1 Tax=Chitinophaga sp. TaxID=1869181 RepID=UPI002F95C7E9